MEIGQLKIFHMAAQELNFTKTAEKLGYAQSNITKQIHGLEDELGVKLFERLGKKIFLTKEGQVFFEHTDRILLQVAAVKESVNPLKFHSSLQVGAAESICVNSLPHIFQHFSIKHPETPIQLKMESCYNLADMVRNNQVDVALVIAGRIEEPDLIVRTLREEKMCLVASPLNSLARNKTIQPNDLKNICLIITSEGCGYRPLILSMFKRYNVMPARMMELTSVATIRACVLANIGVAILPEIAVKEAINTGELIKINADFIDFHVYTQLFYHRDKVLNPALSYFIENISL